VTIWLPQTGWQFAGAVLVVALALEVVGNTIARIIMVWRRK